MAYQIGTANDFEDLFTKIVDFLTTNTTLVANGQNWQVLRMRRDNLHSFTTDLNNNVTGSAARLEQTFRYDCRSLNTDNPTTSTQADFTDTNFSAPKHVTMRLRQAREVKVLQLRNSPQGSSTTNSASPRDFQLQWSDNGTSWTNALTVTGQTGWSGGDVRTFAVPGSPGAHEWWRIIFNAVVSGSRISWSQLLLLEDDGTVANHFGSEVIFNAPGNGGTDNIYTGIRSEYSDGPGWYNLFLNGYTGFNPNIESWLDQPGALPGWGAAFPLATPMVPCWNTTMPFWFVASGRSFRFGVRVSGNSEGGYLGYILPYATPGQYPYPLAVGGSLTPQSSSRAAEWRFSYVSWHHGVFPAPGCENRPDSEGRWATFYLRSPDGEWYYTGNRRVATNNNDPETIFSPTLSNSSSSGAWRSMWPHCMYQSFTNGTRPYRECLGGGYMLQPCVILQRGPVLQVFGELEGSYIVSGFNMAAEDTVTQNGKDHIVFNNAYRTAAHEFWALSLDE